MDFNLLLVNVFQKLAARKFFFWGLFFVILMGAIAGAYVKPQRFESSATILVTLQSSRLNTSHSEQQQLSVTLQAEELIASQIELMQTRDLMEEMVDTLPEWVFVSPPSSKWYIRLIVNTLNSTINGVKSVLRKAKLIEPENDRFNRIYMLEKGLKIHSIRKAHAIEASFRAKNPETPTVVLETLVSIYERRLAELRVKSEGSELYQLKAENLNEQLAMAEKERADFMIENDITNLEMERANLLERMETGVFKADVARLNELKKLEPQLNSLSRRQQILQDSYRAYRTAAQDRQTVFDRDTNILMQVIDPPRTIYKPLKPSRLVLVILGTVLSFILTIIIVLLADWWSAVRKIYGQDKPKSKKTKPAT